MLSILIRLYGDKNKILKDFRLSDKGNHLVISDKFFQSLFCRDELKSEGIRINDVKFWNIFLVCENMIIEVKDYKLHQKISIHKASDGDANIHLLKSNSVNLHLVGLNIETIQTSDCDVLLADCKINRFDHEIENHFNELQDKEFIRINQKYKIDIRNSIIKNMFLFYSVDYFNLQSSKIENLELFHHLQSSLTIRYLNIWQASKIYVMRLGCEIEKLNFEDSNISRLYFISNAMIKEFTISKSFYDKVFGCRYENFQNIAENELNMIKNSALNDDIGLYYDSSYKLAELKGKNRNLFVNFFLKHSIGYGYKPRKGLLFIVAVIIVFGLIYSLIDGIVFLTSGNQPVISVSNIIGSLEHILNRIYFSGITFTTTGFGDIVPNNWVVKLLTIIESSLGVIMYSLLIFSMTVKYLKE